MVKQNFEEVRELREDYQMLPIVVAGNKLDLPVDHRRVAVEDASEWLYCELPKMRWVRKNSYWYRNIFDFFNAWFSEEFVFSTIARAVFVAGTF